MAKRFHAVKRQVAESMKPHAGKQGGEPGIFHPGADNQGYDDQGDGINDVDRYLPGRAVVDDRPDEGIWF